LSIVQII